MRKCRSLSAPSAKLRFQMSAYMCMHTQSIALYVVDDYDFIAGPK